MDSLPGTSRSASVTGSLPSPPGLKMVITDAIYGDAVAYSEGYDESEKTRIGRRRPKTDIDINEEKNLVPPVAKKPRKKPKRSAASSAAKARAARHRAAAAARKASKAEEEVTIIKAIEAGQSMQAVVVIKNDRQLERERAEIEWERQEEKRRVAQAAIFEREKQEEKERKAQAEIDKKQEEKEREAQAEIEMERRSIQQEREEEPEIEKEQQGKKEPAIDRDLMMMDFQDQQDQPMIPMQLQQKQLNDVLKTLTELNGKVGGIEKALLNQARAVMNVSIKQEQVFANQQEIIRLVTNANLRQATLGPEQLAVIPSSRSIPGLLRNLAELFEMSRQ